MKHPALAEWARQWRTTLEYIQPGKSLQNADVGRFNRRVRYERLSKYHWEYLDQIQRAVAE